MKYRELNLMELEEVIGGRKITDKEELAAFKTEYQGKYDTVMGKIEDLTRGYHGNVKRGTQVYSALRGLEKEAKGYQREYHRKTGENLI